jgi:hypothetical protein
MVFMGQRCAEEGHDAVSHYMGHRPLILVDCLHHPFDYRIEKLPGFFGVALGDQLHRPLEIGKQNRNLFAFAFEGGPGGENLLS